MRNEQTDKNLSALVMQKKRKQPEKKTRARAYDDLTAAAQILSARAMWFMTQFATYA